MKNLKLILAAVVLASFSFITSCQKDDSLNQKQDENTTIPEPISDLQSEQGTDQHELGVELLPEIEYQKLEKFQDEFTPLTLPSSVSLTCPPIRSQGNEGSCTAWGVAYESFSIAYRKKHGGSFSYSTNIFSPEYVFNQIKSNASICSGANVITAMNLIKNQGVCTWAKMPYSSTNGCNKMPNSTQRADASHHKIVSYSTITRSATAIKKQLGQYNRAVIIVTPVDSKFDNLGNNKVYTGFVGPSRGLHCYTVVGYNDTKHAFKVMNSWGANWASAGYGWISYSAMNSTFCMEAYILNL